MISCYIRRLLSLCLLCCVSLSFLGCGKQTAQQSPPNKGSETISESIEVKDEHDMHTLALPLRLAFMTGHVKAGMALYRAGELQMAAPHLLHPVSETHKKEREGIDKIGFNGSLFEQVSAALEAKQLATDIEPLLVEAEANLAMVAQRAGGDTVEIIEFLLATTVDEYTIAINNGVITDLGEYQDAFGFVQVAIAQSASLPSPLNNEVMAGLEPLAALWSEGPLPVEMPTSVAKVTDLAAKVSNLLK
jgi:hypothetical protein